MALEVTTTHLTNGKGGGATSFNTASISPSSNKLIICTVFSQVNSGGANEPTMSGNGLTWTKITTQANTSDNNQRITAFRAMGAPTAGAATIDFGGQTTTSVFWGIEEFGNVEVSGAAGANAVVQSTTKSENNGDPMSMTLTLSAFGSTKNATYAAMIGPDTTTQPAGFTSIFTDTQDLGPDNNVAACWKAGNSTSSIFTSTGTGANVATGLAFEIKFAINQGGFIFNMV